MTYGLECSRCGEEIAGKPPLHYLLAFKLPDYSERVAILCVGCLHEFFGWFGGLPKWEAETHVVPRERVIEAAAVGRSK